MYIYIYIFGGFLEYLRIRQFVWARVLFATRYCQSAPVECSGANGKNYVRENSVSQGVAHACYHDGFQHLDIFDEAPETIESPGVRADAQCCKIDILKWLEELVSQSLMPPSVRDLQHCASVLGGS